MSKIEGESFVKMRTNLGTRVLIMTSRTKLRAVLRELKHLKVMWAVFPVHIISCRYISFVFSLQLIKITKPNKKIHCKTYIVSSQDVAAIHVARLPRATLTAVSYCYRGLFIDIAGENIINKITLGNIYKPPKDNSNNQNMSCFIDEITPSLHTLSKENSNSILVGDFNIDLLKLNERHIFSKLFDNMCSSGFFPHITVPSRFATNRCSLIDQIYIKKKKYIKT